jgi:hypothetical protein
MQCLSSAKRARAAMKPSPAAKKAKTAAPKPQPKTKKTKKKKNTVDGVGDFGRDRWGRAIKSEHWSPAEGDDAAKFWIIMFVLTFVPMRMYIAIRKIGRHRMAADGMRSYEIAFFMMNAALEYFNIDPGTKQTPDLLYKFGACV